MQDKQMRIGIVTTHPPGTGTLNEYAFHFIRSLRQESSVSEIILYVDELPDGEEYAFPKPEGILGSEDGQGYLAPVHVETCWQFNSIINPLRILRAVNRTKPDVVLFNIQFASFGSSKVPAALGLAIPALLKRFGYLTAVLLHNIMETVDLKISGYTNNFVIEKLIRLFGTAATRMLLQTDMVALTIQEYVEIIEEKYKPSQENSNVYLIPHGAFDETLPPTYTLPDGPLQIMTFGKFGTYKKVEKLIEAFQQLSTSERPRLKLVIAGGNSPNTPDYVKTVALQYKDDFNIDIRGDAPELKTVAEQYKDDFNVYIWGNVSKLNTVIAQYQNDVELSIKNNNFVLGMYCRQCKDGFKYLKKDNISDLERFFKQYQHDANESIKDDVFKLKIYRKSHEEHFKELIGGSISELKTSFEQYQDDTNISIHNNIFEPEIYCGHCKNGFKKRGKLYIRDLEMLFKRYQDYANIENRILFELKTVEYKDAPNICFTGYVPEDDIEIIFDDAAVVVLPYDSTTGSSGILHQAGDYGKAAVLPNIGDFKEIIIDEGYMGEFFEPNNADSMAAAIARVIYNPERRIELGKVNYSASFGLQLGDVIDWYLLHFERLLMERESTQ